MSEVLKTCLAIMVAIAGVTAIICLIVTKIDPDGSTRSEPEDRDDHVGQGRAGGKT
jgi:hypothetical protein